MQPPWNSEALIAAYPIGVFQDRYGGVYSGEPWIAVANADEPVDGVSRAQWLLQSGAYGSDPDASVFWAAPPDWVATGATPDAAVEKLVGAIKGRLSSTRARSTS